MGKTELRIQPKKLKLSTVNRKVLEITSRYKCNKTTRGHAKKVTRLHNQRREGTEQSVNLRIQVQCNNVLFLLTQNRLMNPYTNCLKDFQLLDITRTTQYRLCNLWSLVSGLHRTTIIMNLRPSVPGGVVFSMRLVASHGGL